MNNEEILKNAPDGATVLAELVAKDKRIAELEKELGQRLHHFVGYTNGNQISYAKEEEGSFYPDTDNDCYIPLYMLDVHLHRLGGTESEEWMNSLQTKQLRAEEQGQ
ncbi:MAG: hypothetical protein GW763_11330 [Paraglaciecola sp.]|nr:hypothetical protein [Paraglaciecola sp.]NCT48560.1 hypothetical protein [Paraglaciecola sp.]